MTDKILFLLGKYADTVFTITCVAIILFCVFYLISIKSSINAIVRNRELELAVSLHDREIVETIANPKPRVPTQIFLIRSCESDNQTMRSASRVPAVMPKMQSSDEQDQRGFSPFLAACWKCDLQAMESLLNNGVDPCQKTLDGANGMVLCAYRMAKRKVPWNPKCLALLLDAGCPIDEPTNDENTALHMAVKASHFKVTAWLAQNGADINKPNHRGWSPYALARCIGDPDIVNVLAAYDEVPADCTNCSEGLITTEEKKKN